MKRLSIFLAAALLSIVPTTGVHAQFDVGGLVIDPSTMTAMDMFSLSQSNFNFGTARSAAMAGAFTSLGADMSSMAINPAGLGMYRHNEFSITPQLTFHNSKTGAGAFEKTDGSRFSLGNVGLVLKLRESDKGVTAVNLGIGYNRIADFNYRYSFAMDGGNSTIADALARQFDGTGITADYLKSDGFSWSDVDPALWGPTLGYFAGLIGEHPAMQNGSPVLDDQGNPLMYWDRDMIGSEPSVGQFTTVNSRGSVNEFLISLGMNMGSKFYIGASLGIQSVYMARDIYYGEEFSYNADPGLNYRMDYFNYDQSARINGAGVNFKIGVIYRPIKSLRIGVAYHTPSFYSLTYKYKGGMTSRVFAANNVDGYELGPAGYLNPPLSETTPSLVDDGNNSWDFSTPSRLLVGVSYTIGKLAVVSVDYQRDWYNGIRTKNSPLGQGLYDNFCRENFQGSNNLRVGAEVKVIPQVALRAGYALWSSGLKDSRQVFSSPMIYHTDYASAGVGISLSKAFFLDLAYQYQHDRMTAGKAWYYYNEMEDGASPTFNTKIDRHTAILTLGCRF